MDQAYNLMASQTVALWIIACLWLVTTIFICIGMIFFVKFLQESLKIFSKIEKTSDEIKEKVIPLIEETRNTLEEVKVATERISLVASKTEKALNVFVTISNTIKTLTSFVPAKLGNASGGFISGIIEGISLFKKCRNNKMEEKNDEKE